MPEDPLRLLNFEEKKQSQYTYIIIHFINHLYVSSVFKICKNDLILTILLIRLVLA